MRLTWWVRALPGHGPSRAAPPRTTAPLGTGFLPLEDRAVPSAFRTFDGTGNNVAHPAWGAVNADFLRLAPAAYADGLDDPAGGARPGARAVSNALADQADDQPANDRFLSNFVYAWGQFIDHDIDLTAGGTEAFPIPVPAGDPYFDPAGTGTRVIPLARSAFDPATSATNPRQQVNLITAYIDGSMVYGSDAATAAALRALAGGRMKTSAGNLLPTDAAGFFLTGDVRANENPQLLALHTLFVREHNRLAAALARANPGWGDERLYQEARRRVVAEIQAITFNEWLPALLGPAAPGAYRGYDPRVNPGIANEFATAAFRFGHSLVGDDVEFLDDDGRQVRPAVSLRDAFFNPALVKETGIDPLLKYLASDNAEEIDVRVIDGLRNFLFGPPGAGGLDLAALNIQRGRDHGLADYNSARAAVGLPRVTDFAQITSDPALQRKLREVYGSVDDIDLWVGGLAEDHARGGSLGPTFGRIVADQFRRLRDGDRFWYERDFAGSRELDGLRRTTLADVIRRNTGLTNLQENVFVFRPVVAGRVYADFNRDGRANPGEPGLANRVVQLLDAGGAVVATTVTRSDGTYRFDAPVLGDYTVRLVPPPGTTTAITRDVSVTRGGVVTTDLGEPPPPGATTPPPPGPRRR